MKLYRVINTRDFGLPNSWILDSKYLPECCRLVTISDHRQMCFFDLFSIKARLIAVISHLENNPLCIAVTSDYDENTDLIIYGDDGGFVNVLTVNRRFFSDNNGKYVSD